MAFDTSVLDKTGWHILEELQHNDGSRLPNSDAASA